MCKKVVIFLLLAFVCFLTACSEKNNVSGTDNNTSIPALLQNEMKEQAFMQTNKNVPAEKYNVDSNGNVWNYLSTLTILYKSGDNYEIYTDEGVTGFYYIVKDGHGELLDQGYHNWKGSFDLEYQNGLLVLDYGYGGNAWDERYYDISGGRVSRVFPSPEAVSDKLVAYFVSESDGQIKLIVQDIFDSSVYYKEIVRDFSGDVYKVHFSGEFLDNNTKLRITYPVKDKEETVTEDILLD